MLEEAERQLTATAAKEAVVAPWRHTGVPVAVEGAGIELVTIPAALRGTLRPEDIVEAVAGRPTTTLGAFWAAAAATRHKPVRLSLRRAEDRREVTVPAGWIYSAPGEFFVAPAEVEVTGAPQPLEVDHHGLSGPSAGLAWALAAIERIEGLPLVEADHLVGATGAVSADGAVHDVGSVPQKAAAVARAGAKMFLIPEALAPVARHHAGGGACESSASPRWPTRSPPSPSTHRPRLGEDRAITGGGVSGASRTSMTSDQAGEPPATGATGDDRSPAHRAMPRRRRPGGLYRPSGWPAGSAGHPVAHLWRRGWQRELEP